MRPTHKEKMLDIYKRQLINCEKMILEHEAQIEISKSVIDRNNREANELRLKITDVESDNYSPVVKI